MQFSFYTIQVSLDLQTGCELQKTRAKRNFVDENGFPHSFKTNKKLHMCFGQSTS